MEWMKRTLRKARGLAAATLDAFRSPRGIWRRHIGEEVAWWGRWTSSKGLRWPEEFLARQDPKAPLGEPLIIDVLDRMGERVEILDVGAGPLTVVGTVYPGKVLAVTAVDPVADEYDRLLERAGISPPIRTMRCEGERLLKRFMPDSFDIAYARNALDHAVDPVRVIRNMIAVVRPGGYVLLRHFPNEGDRQSYHGLHRWNFNLEDSHFVVWQRRLFGRKAIDMTALLRREAEVECRLDDKWLVCTIRKRG